MNDSRITYQRNRLTCLVAVCVLLSLFVSVIFICAWDKSTLNAQAPISISSYFGDYALLSAPIRIDNKLYKIKGNGSYTTRLTLAENKKVAYFLLHSQTSFDRSLGRISTCFAYVDTTSSSWLRYTCQLLDLPPPPPAKFMEPIKKWG